MNLRKEELTIMNHKGTITTLAGFQKQYAELYKSIKGIVAVSELDVHIMDYLFVDLFHEEEVVKSKEDDSQYPYRYRAEKFGTEFVCMSREPLEFKKYPIEEIAMEILCDWDKRDYKNQFRVVHEAGTYRLRHDRFRDNEERTTVYTYEQYESEESIDLESAILDYEEVLQDESNV